MVIEEGRRVSEGLPGNKRVQLLQTCNEAEALANQLSDLVRRGMVRATHSPPFLHHFYGLYNVNIKQRKR